MINGERWVIMGSRKVLVTLAIVEEDASGILLFFSENGEKSAKEGRFVSTQALGGRSEDPKLKEKLRDIANKFNGFIKEGTKITPIKDWQPKYINIVD